MPFTARQYGRAGRHSWSRLPWIPGNLCRVGQSPVLELEAFILAAWPWMACKPSPKECKSIFINKIQLSASVLGRTFLDGLSVHINGTSPVSSSLFLFLAPGQTSTISFGILYTLAKPHLGFPGDTVVKKQLPVQETQEMWVWSLGQEDPLEKEVATHSSILARTINSMDREAWWATVYGVTVRQDWATNTFTLVSLSLVFFLLKLTLDSCKNCVQIKIIANTIGSMIIH